MKSKGALDLFRIKHKLVVENERPKVWQLSKPVDFHRVFVKEIFFAAVSFHAVVTLNKEPGQKNSFQLLDWIKFILLKDQFAVGFKI